MRRTAAMLCGTAALGSSDDGRAGYGPFSNTVRKRLQHQQHCGGAASDNTTDVMAHVQLPTNYRLRASLAGLAHPSQMSSIPYNSPEWRLHMVRLYRTILRLHNKTVAVSLEKSQTGGPGAAVASVTGVRDSGGAKGSSRGFSSEEQRFLNNNSTADSSSSSANRSSHRGNGTGATTPCSQEQEDPTPHSEDCLLRYLLTEQQREFGNRFVQQEFKRHMDADVVYAGIFYESWYQYVLHLSSGVTSKDLNEEEKKLLTAAQKEKLKELRGAFLSLRAANEPGYMP